MAQHLTNTNVGVSLNLSLICTLFHEHKTIVDVSAHFRGCSSSLVFLPLKRYFALVNVYFVVNYDSIKKGPGLFSPPQISLMLRHDLLSPL